MIRNVTAFLTMATLIGAVALTSGTARAAGSYIGNWPLTVTHSQFGDGTYCLTLSSSGAVGWPQRGAASLKSSPDGTQQYGSFEVIDGILVVTVVEYNGGGGQNNSLAFIAPASDGNILGMGVYDLIAGGETFDSGQLAFGTKGGC
jgi:hypothetical protein